MIEIATRLDMLSGIFPTFIERVLVTATVLVTLFICSYIVNRIRRWLSGSDRLYPPLVDLTLSFFIAILVVVGTALIAGIWGMTEIIVRAMVQAGIGPESLSRIIISIAILAGTFLVIGFAKRFIDEYIATHEAVSEHQREVIYRMTQVTLYVTAGLIILGVWEIDLSGFLIGAGFLGIILGFAARQSIAAVVSGFVLMFSRPIEIGDWIELQDHEGIVTDITAFNTRVQTFDGEYVIVPNDEVASQVIINRSRKGRLRLRVEVGVDYDTDLDHAAATIKNAISDLDEILSVPTPQVVLTRFGESAIIFEIKFWIDKPSTRRRWRAIQAVVHTVHQAFRKEGIRIPFPQRELSGRHEHGGFKVVQTSVPSSNYATQHDGDLDEDSQ